MKSSLIPFCLAILGASAQDNDVSVTTTLASAASAAATSTGMVSSGVVTVTGSDLPGFTQFPGKPSITEVLSSEPELSMLNTLVRNEKYSDTLDNLKDFVGFTFLAPSNNALQDFLDTDAGKMFQSNVTYAENLLSYHALNSGGPLSSDQIPEGGIAQSAWFPSLYIYNESDTTLNGEGVGALKNDDGAFFISGFLLNSTVMKADIQFDQGYIHVIDRVLTLPGSLEDTLVAGNFQGTLGALQKSNINSAEALTAGNTSFTFFAPTNRAFLDIGSALEDISADDLTDILSLHVIPGGPFYAIDLKDGEMLPSLNGHYPTITIEDGNIFIEGAKVVAPNLVTHFGVIHGIDEVLNPNNLTTGIPEDGESGTIQFQDAQPFSSLALTDGQPTPTSAIPLPAAATSIEPYTGAAVTNAPALGMLVAGGLALAVF